MNETQVKEFVKVEGKPVEDVPAPPLVAAAYGFIWAAVLVYVIGLARRVGRARIEIAELRRKLPGGGA